MVLSIKSVGQFYAPSSEVLELLEVFRRMVNDSIRIGLVNDASSLRRLSLLSYNQLAHYDSPSCYKVCAISPAAGILAARKKSLRKASRLECPVLSDPVSSPVMVSRSRMGGWRFLYREGSVSGYP